MPYSSREIEDLYDQPSFDDHLESLRAKGLQYRAKLIRSGDAMLEVEIYPINPIWKDNKNKPRVKPVRPSRKAQKDLNQANTRKHVSRLIHTNFTRNDIWVTFTYGREHMPADVAEATKHLKNYFKRLRRHIKKHGLPELKYIYVTERTENEKTGKVHTHHHVIMNFRDRDTAEALWTLGGRTHARRLQPDKDGSLGGLANYISKPETKEGNRKGDKTYARSKNLVKPDPITSPNRLPLTGYRISKKRISEMAINENTAIRVLEENYKGYRVADIKVKFSEYTAGVFIYVHMVNPYANMPASVDRRLRE